NRATEQQLRFTNPTDREIVLQISLVAPAGVKLGAVPEKIKIPAKSDAQLHFAAAATDSFATGSAGFLLQLGLPDGSNGTFGIPAVLSRGAKEPDFELSGKNRYHRLIPDAPGHEKYYYQGPDDLSAKIFLGRTRDSAVIEAIVRDDIHEQKQIARDLWKGDSLQIQLALPGKERIWQFGCARSEAGNPMLFAWISPFDEAKTKQSLAKFKLTTSRDEATKTTKYRLVMPFSALGTSGAELDRGVRFNLIVNDSDFGAREGFLFVAPGLGVGDFAAPLLPAATFQRKM
ncbi:MAG: hypothetical protein PHS41_09985, partial [Victivallaceae bacterium]|nr:hypothetical protein [Victivallaceae bacterium]